MLEFYLFAVNLLSRLHTTLAEKALLVLSFNYDIIKQNNQIQAFMQDIYHKLYQTGINVTIICGNQCSQSILEQVRCQFLVSQLT